MLRATKIIESTPQSNESVEALRCAQFQNASTRTVTFSYPECEEKSTLQGSHLGQVARSLSRVERKRYVVPAPVQACVHATRRIHGVAVGHHRSVLPFKSHVQEGRRAGTRAWAQEYLPTVRAITPAPPVPVPTCDGVFGSGGVGMYERCGIAPSSSIQL